MTEHGFFIYMAADNELNPYGRLNDLKEIQRAQKSENAWPVAVQFHSPKEDDKNRPGVISLSFKQGRELTRQQEIKSINTGDPAHLLDFLHWAGEAIDCLQPSLIIWGHGTGPLDGEKASDFVTKAVAFDYSEADALTTEELSSTLKKFLRGKRFSILGFDACYMASVEVAFELSSICDVYVGSQSRVPEIGWPYELVMNELSINQPTKACNIAKLICSNFLSLYSKEKKACISALDTAELPALVNAMRNLTDCLLSQISKPETFMAIYRARSKTTFFGDADKSNFIDLLGFVTNLSKMFKADDAIVTAAETVADNIHRTVLSNQTQGFNAAGGISILFPLNPLTEIIENRYSMLAFNSKTGWHQLLNAFHKPK